MTETDPVPTHRNFSQYLGGLAILFLLSYWVVLLVYAETVHLGLMASWFPVGSFVGLCLGIEGLAWEKDNRTTRRALSLSWIAVAFIPLQFALFSWLMTLAVD